VRKLRAERRLSQKDFCSEVFKDSAANAVKALSKIENGIQGLSGDQIKQIEKFFGVSMDDEVAEFKRTTAATPLAILPDSDYFDYLKRFYDKACASTRSAGSKTTRVAPAEVWFFHPLESLPVLKSESVHELWLKNLQRGIDKHFVWPLPITTSGDLAAFYDLSVGLVDKLCAAKSADEIGGYGRITFWACNDIGGSTNSAMERRFNEYRDQHASSRLPLVFNDVLQIGSLPEFQDILSLDSVILNLPTNPELPRYAAEFLDDIGSQPNSAGASGWLFKGGRTRTRLMEMVRGLKELHSAKTEKGKSS
jgi:transcriptional regulator with XRE-family HTH domain